MDLAKYRFFFLFLKTILTITIILAGYKETAFAYAISAAGVTHQVSKACSMGKLKSCGCDMSVLHGHHGHHGHKHGHPGHNQAGPTAVGQTFEWGGCSHNVDFGERYAKRFLDYKEEARDIHSQINLHNNRAGRLVGLEGNARSSFCFVGNSLLQTPRYSSSSSSFQTALKTQTVLISISKLSFFHSCV